jgi:predicted NBD/HSP70 family sugar kinase
LEGLGGLLVEQLVRLGRLVPLRHRTFVATGIGAGVVLGGSVYRGIDGGAGDIGHIRLHGHDDARCLCGFHGCLTAVASGSAVAAREDYASTLVRLRRAAT